MDKTDQDKRIQDCATEERIQAICDKLKLPNTEVGLRVLSHAYKIGFRSVNLVRVPPDYYSRSLEGRKELIGPKCASVEHLCKSLLFVNKRCEDANSRSRENSKYYLVIVQYCRKIESHELFKAMRELGRGLGMAKRDYKFDVANANDSDELTGFAHNGVTPIGMKDPTIPIVLDESITRLHPGVFWLGGGEEDLKLSLRVDDFVKIFNPIVVSITRPREVGDGAEED